MPFSVCFARDFAQLMGVCPDSPGSPKLAGIKNNTRAPVDPSAGSEFIAKLYAVAILKLLAE